MQSARIPTDEADRLKALRDLQLLDSTPSQAYDCVTRFAAQALGTPIVLVSLIDAHRQWFKSRVGLDATETARDISFCGHAIYDRKPLIVPDATKDERFADNPLVTGEPHVRAYMGVPLLTRQGHAIGTLCAIDRDPRQFDADELKQLEGYAKILEESIHAQELARATDDVLKFATEREQLFRDTFEQAAVGIIHAAPTGQLLRINQHSCEMLGYSEAEMLALTLSQITHPDDLAREVKVLKRMLAGGLDRYRVENRFRCKDGEYLWTEVSVALKRGVAGERDYVIAVIADISARKLAEQELLTLRDSLQVQVDQQTAKIRESNHALELQIVKALESERAARDAMNQLRHFHHALDQHASVDVTDANGIITYANQRFSHLSGYDQSELIGQNHRTMNSGVHTPEVFEDLWRTVLAGSVWHGELCNRNKNGELYWIDAAIVPYKDDTGRITQFVSIRSEITERKMAQEKLAAEERKSRQINERLRQIADNIPATITYWDQDGICRFANQAHVSRFGLRPQEIVGMTIQKLLGAKYNEKRAHIEAALAGQRQLFEHSAPMVDGSIRQWHTDYVPHLQDGQVVGFYALAVDITQQKQVEAELAQTHKLESIGQLSAGIAHEINTPTQFIGDNVGFLKDSIAEIFASINLITGITKASINPTPEVAAIEQVLKKVDLEYLLEEVPKAIGQSLEGIERIRKIVSAMKEFSHPATEKMLVDLNRAISSTIVVASNEWKYVADMETDFDQNLPHVAVIPGSFNQVILNMIVNAAHAVAEAAEAPGSGHGAKGTISVSTRQIGCWAEIRIKDTGCGIPASIRDRIFDQFFTTKAVGKGTGQGLAIAQDVIVKKHGGVIAVESEPGVGTAFILRLPMTEQSQNAIAAA